MQKFIEIDPLLNQNARNLAFMVGSSDYDEDDASGYEATNYEWPDVDAETVATPIVECEGCFELESCEGGSC